MEPGNATKLIEEPEIQEDPATFEAIEKLLSSNNIQYKKLTHKPTKTSEESAQVRGVSLASGAKAMLIKQEKDSIFVLLVLSAARKLSSPKKCLGTIRVSRLLESMLFSFAACGLR